MGSEMFAWKAGCPREKQPCMEPVLQNPGECWDLFPDIYEQMLQPALATQALRPSCLMVALGLLITRCHAERPVPDEARTFLLGEAGGHGSQ